MDPGSSAEVSSAPNPGLSLQLRFLVLEDEGLAALESGFSGSHRYPCSPRCYLEWDAVLSLPPTLLVPHSFHAEHLSPADEVS